MANRVGCRLGISECLVANMLTEFNNYAEAGNVIHKKLTTFPAYDQVVLLHTCFGHSKCSSTGRLQEENAHYQVTNIQEKSMLDPIPTLEPGHDNNMVPLSSSLSTPDYILIPTLTENTPLLERPPLESQPCPKRVCTKRVYQCLDRKKLPTSRHLSTYLFILYLRLSI